MKLFVVERLALGVCFCPPGSSRFPGEVVPSDYHYAPQRDEEAQAVGDNQVGGGREKGNVDGGVKNAHHQSVFFRGNGKDNAP